jgi:hypothetical protein
MRPMFNVLLNPCSIAPPLLLCHTQALTAPAAHSISLPAFVPLALPETSKVSFFFTFVSVAHCATFLCTCTRICNCHHFNLLNSSGRIVTLLAMPPAWVDFSWVLVQVKRDNVKQNSVIVSSQVQNQGNGSRGKRTRVRLLDLSEFGFSSRLVACCVCLCSKRS